VLATLTCTFGTVKVTSSKGEEVSESLPPYEEIEVRIAVAVEPGARTGAENTASVSGGGAVGTRTATHAIEVGGDERFGVEDYELIPEDPSGSVDTRAGSHPFQLTSVVTLNTTTPEPGGEPRGVALAKDVSSELPAGLIADPAPLARCGGAQFVGGHEVEEHIVNECPAQSAVGVATLTFNEPGVLGLHTVTAPIFNLEPLPGGPARFGIEEEGLISVFLDTSVRTGGDYGVTLTAANISETVWLLSLKLTFWGVPGDARHDSQRGWECLDGFGTCPSSTAANPPPFLALPTSCNAPWASTLHADSWASEEHPSQVAEPFTYELEEGGHPLKLDGCDQLPFAPEVTVTPVGTAASTPTGLSVDVHVPQSTATDSEELTESTVRDITLALPEGMTLNPAGANGLEACSESQIGFAGFNQFDPEYEPGVQTPIFTPSLPEPLQPGVNFCPEASKIGTVKLQTPLLANALEGSVYLAAQSANPFGSLVAAYLVAKDPVSGVLVKLPGALSLSPQTGRITATFENTPQLPIEELDLDFFGSERALLATPAHCGSYTTTVSLTPWSAEEDDEAAVTKHVESTFDITSGPNGTACPGATLPFNPSLTGGVTNLNAGAFSPLTVTVSRADGQQSLQAFALRLPAGVSGMLSGVPLCAEAQATAGTCPAASQIGETTVAAGLGADPYILTGGEVYLTGPYNGTGSCTPGGEGAQSSSSGCAPFGLSIVTPVKAGPLDLENAPENHPPCDCLVIRAGIDVDPQTAQLTIATGGIPSIIDGVPLQIKDLNITINRPGFIFNPTSCAKMKIEGTITGGEGASSSVSAPLQLGNCTALGFKPRFTISTSGKTSRQNGASLHVKLAYPKAPLGQSEIGQQANLASVKVDLPRQLVSRLATLGGACLARTFEADPAACPASSRVGTASVTTPVLPGVGGNLSGRDATPPGRDGNLSGPAYFVSHGGKRFPELMLVLQGDGVTVDLTGETSISSAGVTSSTFRAIPDVPVETFELNLPEGSRSVLAANGKLCQTGRTVTVVKRVEVRVHGHVHTVTRRVKEKVGGLVMPTALTAQNGAVIHQNTPISVTGCPPARPKAAARKRHIAV